MTSDSLDNGVLLFGGCGQLLENGSCGSYLHDTWLFSGLQWRELTPAVFPSARAGAATAWDPLTESVILFGGEGTNGLLNDTWSFSGGGWSLLKPQTAPPPTIGAAMAWDSGDSELVLVGGNSTREAAANPTGWTFAGGDWHRVSPGTAPPDWVFSFMSPDPQGAGVILEGGLTNPDSLSGPGESWLFSGGVWTNATEAEQSTPPGRAWGLAGFDPITFNPILYGGGGTNWTATDAWELTSPSGWLRLDGAADPPASFVATQGAMDPSDYVNIEFCSGSLGATPASGAAVSSTTWALLTDLTISVNSLGGAAPLEAGTNLSFDLTISGGIPPYTVSWEFGDGGSGIGSQTNHTYLEAGSYAVSVNVSDAVNHSIERALGSVNVSAQGSSLPSGLGSSTTALEAGIVVAAVVAVVVCILVWHRWRYRQN